jgi:hypothetical protein
LLGGCNDVKSISGVKQDVGWKVLWIEKKEKKERKIIFT